MAAPFDVPAFRAFVDAYRVSCLWFLNSGYYPSTPAEIESVILLIERHGDRQAFLRAAQFRQWLLPHSSPTSVTS